MVVTDDGDHDELLLARIGYKQVLLSSHVSTALN